MRIVVRPTHSPLRGAVPGPLDPDAAGYALAIAACAQEGESRLDGRGLPETPMVPALQALGVSIDALTDTEGRRLGWRVRGGGLQGMHAAEGPLDAAASAATMAALSAIAAALPFHSTLTGDAPVMHRCMGAIARTLRMRNGRIEGAMVADVRTGPRRRAGEVGPPFAIGPSDGPLSPLTYELGAPEAWPEVRQLAKATALLSGIDADGPTQLYERLVSEDVVERMLAAAGATVLSLGPMIELRGPVSLAPLRGPLPVDPTLGATLLALGLQRPGSRIGVRRLPTRPTVSGWIEALVECGARISSEAKPDGLGQPAADVFLAAELPRGFAIGGERAHRSGAPLPVLAAMAARAPEGAVSRLFDLGADQDAASTAELLSAFGVECRVSSEGLEVIGAGQRPLEGCTWDTGANQELALAALVLASGAGGVSEIVGPDCLLERAPRLASTLRAVGVDVSLEPGVASNAALRPEAL